MQKEDLLLEKWKVASELHRHEDNLIWQKFGHYVTINGALIALLGVIWSGSIPAQHNELKFATIVLSIFALIFSVVWTLFQARGTLYQRYRIEQVKEAEEALTLGGQRILDLYKVGLNDQTLVTVSKWLKFSAQQVVIYFGWFVVVIWIGIFIYFMVNG